MTAQYRYSNQPNHAHKNLGTSGNSSSPSHTPFFEHTFTYATVRHATTNTLTRLCRSSHETATASTWNRATHTLYHKTGKQSPPSNGSNGQGHGQATQLQATDEQPKIQNSMEPVSSQQIWAIGKWHWRAYQEPYQHYRVHLPTQGTRRLHERHHIWAVRMHGQTQKGRTQLNVILPRQISHPDHRNAGGQNAIQLVSSP